MSIRKLGRVDPVYDALRVQTMMLPFAGGSGVSTAAIAFGKILTIHHDDGGVEVFAVTSAGLTAALAAANAGDAVWLPPCTLVGNWTVPAAVGVQAYGKKSDLDSVTLIGTITLNASTFLQSIYIITSFSSESTIVGVIGSASGTAYIVDCSLVITNEGAGDVHAVESNGGELWIWSSPIQAVTEGAGMAYAIYSIEQTPVYVRFGLLKATSNGIDTNPVYGQADYYSAVSANARAMTLWNGSGNDSPPANWNEIGFDDSGWSEAVELTGFTYIRISGAQAIGYSQYSAAQGEQTLLRQTITLDAKPSSGTLILDYDDILYGWYVNGNLVYGPDMEGEPEAGATGGPFTVDVSQYLVEGENVLAYHTEEAGPGGRQYFAFKLTVEGANVIVYAVEIDNHEGAMAITPQRGDRGAYNVSQFADFHASDIHLESYLRHLPDPIGEPDGNIAYISSNRWIVGTPTEAGIGANFDAILTDDNYAVLVDDNGNVLVDDQ